MAESSLSSTAIPAIAPTPPPAPVDLRPLTTSELIDRGFALYRAHFAGFSAPGAALPERAAPRPNPRHGIPAQSHADPSWLESPATFLHQGGAAPRHRVDRAGHRFLLRGGDHFLHRRRLPRPDSLGQGKPAASSRLPRGASIWTCILNRVPDRAHLPFSDARVRRRLVLRCCLSADHLSSVRLFYRCAHCLLMVASLAPVLIVFMRLMVTVPALASSALRLEGAQALFRAGALRSRPRHSLLGRNAAELPAPAALRHRAAHPFAHLAAARPPSNRRGHAPRFRRPDRRAAGIDHDHQPDS